MNNIDDKFENRIEYINELQNKRLKSNRRQSTVINNFYSLITIIIMCVTIIFYTVYVVPAQESKLQRELEVQKKQEQVDKRAKQIALSHNLNDKK
jgi:cell division protein FtsL